MTFKTKCYYCTKYINTPFKVKGFKKYKVSSCNQCIPVDSALRNRTDEMPLTEYK